MRHGDGLAVERMVRPTDLDGAKGAFPEGVAEPGRGRGAFAVVLRREVAAEGGVHAEDVEEIA